MSLVITIFCYSFFAGIALSMAVPALRAHWVPMLFAAALCAALSGLAALPRRKPHAIVHLDRPASIPLFRLFLALAGLLLGAARHASTYNDNGTPVAVAQAPDTVDIAAAQEHPLSYFLLRADHGETISPSPSGASVGTPFSVVVTGLQYCLEPVWSDRGTPALDASGRWRFTLAVKSAECTVDIPVGATEAPVPVPFSVITGVTPSDGVSLVRLPNRIESFTSPRAATTKDAIAATILGRIHDDPDVYNAMSDDGSVSPRTVLDMEPLFVQPRPGDPFFPVESGRVQTTVSGPSPTDRTAPSDTYLSMFRQVSQTDALGNDVVVRGPLELPQSALNPGGFDNRKFLLSHGFGAQMYLASWQRFHGPALEIVVPDGASAPRTGNPFVMFSLHLRDRMLRVIKETLPFPQSAFASGITLGMRYGMQNAECVLSDASANTAQRGSAFLRHILPDCQDFVSDEFKRAGVNHVLAVSGLHVTIITALLVGIFSLFHANRKVFVPFVLLALVVFSVITGARPSTLRAVIMNSLFLILWAYLRESLKTTVLLSAAIAGFVIMLQSPRLLVNPSFTLSFGAILSLGLLTGPCTRVLNRFRGNDLLALALFAVLAHVILAFGWFRVAAPRSARCLALLAAILFGAGRLLARHGIRPIGDYGFANLPAAAAGFLAAQGAIQLGMMIPLSAYYFVRWPVIGSVANLIAIPLIGIVLQLSMLACIIGLVPYIGPLLALVLNAANWLGCLLFMLVSHFASAWFPYPFVRKPSGFAVGVYYLLLAVFVLWPQIRKALQGNGEHISPYPLRPCGPDNGEHISPYPSVSPLGCFLRCWIVSRMACIAVLCALGALALAVLPREPRADGHAHASVFSVGYGGAVLYQAPSGEHILFDAGYAQPGKSRINQAERTILPRLSALSIRELDALVLLSDRPERLDGAALVLEQCLVRRLVLPPDLAACFDPDTNALLPEHLDALLPPDSDAPAVQESRRAILGHGAHSATAPSLAAILAQRRPSTLNRLLGIAIRIESSDTAALPAATLLPDSPSSTAALLSSGEGAPAMLLAGTASSKNLDVWFAAHPSIRAVSLSDWRTTQLSADALDALESRDGYAFLEYGNTPTTLRRSLNKAAKNYRDTRSICEDVLTPDHVRATDRDGAIDVQF